MTNPILEAKINDIHSWWEVPCIAHFCSLFRASFNLIDFDIEDLEEALLIDDVSDSGNTLIQELIVRLLRGYYGNNSISTFNYQMFLRRLFRQKCREFHCFNPFDNDIDFQFLPMRTKVEILHMLCDFRLDANDVLDILKDLDSDSLRVHPLGYDGNKSAYWYFYGTRLYREDYPKRKKEKEKKRGRKRKRGRNKEEESDEEEVEMGSGIWQVVCFTESDWERLALNTEDATDKNEQSLHQIIEEDFLPEIPKLFQEKERLQKKRFSELHPRKSSRIENLKRRKEEETQYIDKYKSDLTIEDSESEADSERSTKKAKNARYERWKNRNNQKEGFGYSDDENNSDSESVYESMRNCTRQSEFIISRGRQTNNSLSSVTGEIIIQQTEKNQSHEWFDTKLEDLHIGMYKVLKKLKKNEDSWPFLEPVDEEDAPNYYKVVQSPMSLQRMEDKLDSGKYKSLAEFKRDFQLILANCKQYNGSRNEYTVMGENLEKVFNAGVNRYIMFSNSSEGEDVTENSDFTEVVGSHKKKKRRRRKRTNSKSTEDADKENERKLSSLDAVYSVNSMENEVRNADDSLSIESRLSEHKPVKRGKGRPPKNASTFDALDIITEQTLRDINKWLDDTPKYTDFSASNSPPTSNSPRSEAAIDIFSTGTNEILNIQKSVAVRPFKQKDPPKKRSIKENHHKHLQIIKQRRRDNPRTIDRLQPGKSKGNLISTITKTVGNKQNLNDELPGPIKIKESASKAENTARPETILSLGTVLSTDIINLDTNAKKHTFSDNDSIPSEDEDPFSENEDLVATHNELQAENLALDKPYADSLYMSTEDKKIEEKNALESSNTKTETNTSVSTDGLKSNTEKTDKPTPNLSAWFKAFGAPKTQQQPKRKAESAVFNDNPTTPSQYEDIKDDFGTTVCPNKSRLKSVSEDDRYDINELPPPTPGRFFMYDEDKDQRAILSLPSPDVKPMKRQRKLSTGSSVSERSSFSQDPNDPMNSPHPSLDDSVYQSPQPYHQSPIHNTGALKVGFYQDMFPKGGSDKSNSCSPREPMNSISPQHLMFSPRDSIASPRDSVSSPRDIIASPRADPIASPRDPVSGLHVSSPRNAVVSPRYASVSPRDNFSDSIHSPVPFSKSPVYSPTATVNVANPNQQLAVPTSPQISSSYKSYSKELYQTMPQSSNGSLEKSPFSIYPVKKRISAELEQTIRGQYNATEQQETEKVRTERSSFISVGSNQEQEHHFVPTSNCMPQHILQSNPYGSPEPSIPISLSHHHHPHSFVDAYPENILLSSNPYFRKDMYTSSPTVSGTGQTTSHMSTLFMQQTPAESVYANEKVSHNQPHYSPPRQSSPLMTSTYGQSAVPLDFTATTASALPLTSKVNDVYTTQYHHPPKYVTQSDGALNYSSKNGNTSQHSFYTQQHGNESERKHENDYQRGKLESSLQHYASMTVSSSHPSSSVVDMCDSNKKYERTALSATTENVYHANIIDLKHNNYRSNAATTSSFSNASSDYFNGSKSLPPSNYPVSDLRYSNYSTSNDDKQYYSTTTIQSSNKRHIDTNYLADGQGRSIEFLSSNVNASRPAVNFSQTLSNMTNVGSTKHTMVNNMMVVNADNNRYDVAYHNRNIPHVVDPAAGSPVSLTAMSTASGIVTTTATNKSGKKSKRRKAAAVQNTEISETTQTVSPSSTIYSHYLGNSQVSAPSSATPPELKHNGIIPGSAFNFSSPNPLKNEYQQYFDNLRSTRYFAESGVTDKVTSSQPVSNPSFQFLTQGSTPPFGLAAQAFINANPPPCPPPIYSSAYLQRPPEDLLRPVMLPQGLMSAHSSAYPPGYLNMHDSINRSRWL